MYTRPEGDAGSLQTKRCMDPRVCCETFCLMAALPVEGPAASGAKTNPQHENGQHRFAP